MRRRRLLLLAGCALAAILLTLLWPRDREPYYQGKSLSEWLAQPSEVPDATFSEKGAEAVRHMGTNALPWLLGWVRYEPPAWQKHVRTWIEKLPQPVGTAILATRLGKRLDPSRARERWNDATSGFIILGPAADPAIPELTRIMNDPAAPGPSVRATLALGCIGSNSIPPLLSVLTNRKHRNWSYAASAILYLPGHPNLRAAVPLLVARLDGGEDNQWGVDPSEYAATTLGELRIEPEIAVPALKAALSHPRQETREACAEALGMFGAEARLAIPALLEACKDAVPSVREAATNALLKISPDSLPKPSPQN